MNNAPFFSVIIPTYNRAHLIGQGIRSVLMQKYPAHELIIVDDGSTDNTMQVVNDIIKGNPDKKIIYLRQPNSERAASRNKGLLNTTGNYVIYLDSDDELYPEHLLVAKEYITKNSEPEFIHLNYEIKNEAGKVTGHGPTFTTKPNQELIKGNFLSCNGVVLRRDIAMENLFNENRDLSGLEDWELWLRLAIKYPLHYINEITSSILNHQERSVVSPDETKLIKKVDTFMNLILSNNDITFYYSGHMDSFKASCYSYLSLHLALMGKRKDGVTYLFKSIFVSPKFIFKKRFLAIIKHLF